MFAEKMNLIREACSPIVGKTIERFEIAEILHDDGRWSDWPDLPLRLHFSDQSLLAISWSEFDELWLASDFRLPFAVDKEAMRWKENGVDEIVLAIGCMIRGVLLGRGEMTIETREVEIWTRLVFDLGGKWLEVFNALDENGYALHDAKPEGEFVSCV